MSSNIPAGFPGFQARMLGMIEELGGDWLANRAAEQSWTEAVDLQRQVAYPWNNGARPLQQRWHYRSEWTRFTDADWMAAADYGRNRFLNAKISDPLWRGKLGDFWVLGDDRRVSRIGRDPDGPAILLVNVWRAGATDAELSFSDDGEACASFYGRGLRTKHRKCGAKNAAKTLRAMALECGVRIDD